MRKIYALNVAVSLAVAALAASPAVAATDPLAGPYVVAEVGVSDDDFAGTAEGTYGVQAGYDFRVGGVVLGPRVGYSAPFDDEGLDVREISAGVRLGVPVSARTLVYGAADYSDISTDLGDVDGYRLGLGLEHTLPSGLFLGAETRYGNYSADVELYQTVARVGWRFR